MTSPIYSKEQQIYSLSFSTNSAFGLSWKQSDCKSGLRAMQSYVTKISQDILSQTVALIGDWIAIWGPVVYVKDASANSIHADNIMGVYYNPTDNLFVISIAGTNSNSTFSWFKEDFAVNTLITWESISGIPNAGSISQGTSLGLSVLLGVKDASGNTLMEGLKKYLTSNTITDGAEIAVAGHSLGGALAPTLALYLLAKKLSWDPFDQFNISTYPTAGPTPGDKDFAAYYEAQIKAKKITYYSKYNTLDVVPHAWQATDLSTIPTFYDDYITPSSTDLPNQSVVGSLVTIASLIAMAEKIIVVPYKNPYQQISPSTALKGSFDLMVDLKVTAGLALIKDIDLPSNLKKLYLPTLAQFARFVAQAAVQHTTAYHSLLDIADFMAIYKKIILTNKPSDIELLSPDEVAIREVLKIDLGKIDLEDLISAYQQNS